MEDLWMEPRCMVCRAHNATAPDGMCDDCAADYAEYLMSERQLQLFLAKEKKDA